MWYQLLRSYNMIGTVIFKKETDDLALQVVKSHINTLNVADITMPILLMMKLKPWELLFWSHTAGK